MVKAKVAVGVNPPSFAEIESGVAAETGDGDGEMADEEALLLLFRAWF